MVSTERGAIAPSISTKGFNITIGAQYTQNRILTFAETSWPTSTGSFSAQGFGELTGGLGSRGIDGRIDKGPALMSTLNLAIGTQYAAGRVPTFMEGFIPNSSGTFVGQTYGEISGLSSQTSRGSDPRADIAPVQLEPAGIIVLAGSSVGNIGGQRYYLMTGKDTINVLVSWVVVGSADFVGTYCTTTTHFPLSNIYCAHSWIA
jgi:hypothetical protein